MMLENMKQYQEYSVFVLRLAVGVLLLLNGINKLFILAPSGFAGMLEGLGYPIPLFWAWLVSLVELIAGIAILIGFWVRPAALLTGITMLAALFTAHLTDIANYPSGFNTWWLRVLVLAVSITLIMTGAGKYIAVQKEE
jgi:putative oxidoreductase